MVRQIVHYRKRTVNLLRQNHAHKLMGISRFPERNFEICDDFALINHSRVVLDGTVADVRRQFRTGIYDLSTSSDHILTPFNGVEVLSSSKREHSTQYRLRKTDDSMTNSQLLTHIASQVEIESFQEQIPSMNEIFLKVVDNNTNVEPQNTANNE